MKNIHTLCLCLLLFGTSACSLSSVLTSEGMLGTALGTAAGVGAGYAISEQIGKPVENMALVGAAGAGLGMLAGGLLHERNERDAEERSVLIREVRMIGENQREIDTLRENLTESTTWGKGEVKPWNERYWGENYSSPYEGRISH